MSRRRVLCRLVIVSIPTVLVASGCSVVSGHESLFTPKVDSVHVVMWRTSQTELTGYVPVCPGDEVTVGIAVDQEVGNDGNVGVAANDGVVGGTSASLLTFTIEPGVALTGSVTDALPRADTAGGFVRPITKLSELGGFFAQTSRTYASWDLDKGLPDVGEGWVFVVSPEPTVASDLDAQLADALASVNCDEAP